MATSTDSPLTRNILEFSVDDVFLAPLAQTASLGGTGPFVINLQASSAPINLPGHDVAGCPHAYLYRIQRIEDGRMRYRLRLGPFLREDEADAALIRVRDDYPGALTATACAEDLSSIAKIQAKEAALQPSVQAPLETAAHAASLADASPAVPSAVLASPEELVALPMNHAPALAQELELVEDFQEIPGGPAVSPPRPTPTSIDEGFDLSSISLSFELPPPKAADPAVDLVLEQKGEEPEPQLEAAAVPIRHAISSFDSTQTIRPLSHRELQDHALRWFVIELSVADHPFDPATVPNLDIFVLYTLYSVDDNDQGRVTHALRLGFFGEEMAARAVAIYLTTYYEKPTVKRVSLAERERFAERRIDARKDVGETGQHSAIEITSELAVLRPRIARAPAVAAPPRQVAGTLTKKDKPTGLFASLPWVKRRS